MLAGAVSFGDFSPSQGEISPGGVASVSSLEATNGASIAGVADVDRMTANAAEVDSLDIVSLALNGSVGVTGQVPVMTAAGGMAWGTAGSDDQTLDEVLTEGNSSAQGASLGTLVLSGTADLKGNVIDSVDGALNVAGDLTATGTVSGDRFQGTFTAIDEAVFGSQTDPDTELLRCRRTE